MTSDIGIIGIGTMGRNLSLNFLDKGYTVSIYDINPEQVSKAEKLTDSSRYLGYTDLTNFISSIETPRVVLLMVKAGEVTEQVIEKLQSHLGSQDIIIDGGNANYRDTSRRTKYLNQRELYFVGAGISGGAKGARNGPAIMPGGNYAAWSRVKPLLQDIAAIAPNGDPCCHWIGPDGAGHYVKTIHNGIEYADMELIAESYQLLSLNRDDKDIANIFDNWNHGNLESYLIEITATILNTVDQETGKSIVEIIYDSAGQKGTGKWSIHDSLDLGEPTTILAAAVFQRFLSAKKSERVEAAISIQNQKREIPELVNQLENALYVAKIITYAQGFALLQSASKMYDWDLKLDEIAMIWTNGCIIRSKFLEEIQQEFQTDRAIYNLLLTSTFKTIIETYEKDLRKICKYAIDCGISIPGFTAALSYLDGYRSDTLPASLIQAQRDYFGAHGFRRIDKDENKLYHGPWVN